MAQTGNSSDDGSEQGVQRSHLSGTYVEEPVEIVINYQVFY